MKKLACCLGIMLIILAGCSSNEKTSLKPFNISDVQLKEGPFRQRQQTDLAYILAMKPDRLLAPYLKDAGIEPLAENYPNWENTGLDGHIGGHYLSAMAFMYAATGDEELLRRINYMVDWLKKCQDKNGNGYVGGVPGGKEMWAEIAAGNINAGSFSLNDRWVPLYNIHKLYSGLRDVYLNTPNKTSLEILVKLSDWMNDLVAGLSDEQVQDMLRSEHGGLNEIFVDVAQITGDKKYLELANRLSHRALLDPLLNHENTLTGMHANTQIPKVIGYKCYADATQTESWADAAVFFWNTVVDDWTISIGGNSVREHFNPMDDFSGMVESRQGPETCNTYNMLRLTKLLYLTDPEPKYLDYYERALFNHILSSEHPSKGGFVYFTPMRPRHYRVYSQSQLGFWCCVGSGLENPGKYGEMIYAHDASDVYVNLFIASGLKWKEKGLTLTQTTGFPAEEGTTITLNLEKPGKFGIHIRHPEWVKEGGFEIRINGKKQKIKGSARPYVLLRREWESGDEIQVSLPMKNQVEYLPDDSPWVSFLHGPVVLGAVTDSTHLEGLWADDSRMGHVAHGPLYPIDKAPTLVAEKTALADALIPVEGKELTFRLDNMIYPAEQSSLELVPFYTIHEARYMVYWPLISPDKFEEWKASMADKEQKMLALEKKTIDEVATGEQQPESDHGFKGERSRMGVWKEKFYREAEGWFEYQLKDEKSEAVVLRVTYFGMDRDREFDITLNGVLLKHEELDGSNGDSFFDVDYPVPENIVEKNRNGYMQIRFTASEGSRTAAVFYIRLLRE